MPHRAAQVQFATLKSETPIRDQMKLLIGLWSVHSPPSSHNEPTSKGLRSDIQAALGNVKARQNTLVMYVLS